MYTERVLIKRCTNKGDPAWGKNVVIGDESPLKPQRFYLQEYITHHELAVSLTINREFEVYFFSFFGKTQHL